MAVLRTIRLYGVLGARFGREHRLAVSSTAEAIRALSAVIPGFRKFLNESKAHGLVFACFIGKTNIDRDALAFPVGDEAIRIAPIIAGSKTGGIFQTIAGVVLTVVGVYFDNPSLVAMGASMALGGVVQMLSRQPAGLAGTVDNGTSYYFNGPVNSDAQGEPVPVVYGEILVGSKVGSSGIYAEDQV